ncbi:MAG: hypothetical protein ABIH83_03430 [Candidatus Micrarchaeota archaeon]
MGSQEFVKKEEPKTTDGTKNLKDFTPAKVLKLTEEQKTSLVKLRDSLDTRMQEIMESPVMRVGHGGEFDEEEYTKLSHELEVCFMGSLIIDMALERDWKSVEKYTNKLNKTLESWGVPKKADAFLRDFYKIINNL